MLSICNNLQILF